VYTDIVLPNLGFDMQEGRLVAWLKAPGDPLRKGEVIAEIEGDKTTVELEAVADGFLHEILVAPDTVVPVGSVLARIRSADAIPGASTARPSPVAERVAREHQVDLSGVAGSGPGGRITRRDVEAARETSPSNGHKALAAPAVRKLARDHGIDLITLHGSGKEGRVTRSDVQVVIAAQEGRHEVKLSPMRQSIARRLTQSVQEAPHFYTTAELDFTDALAALPTGIGINALLLYTCIKALQACPDLNATFQDGKLYHYDHVHLGIAVALDNGLISPVLHRADDFSLSGLAGRSRELIERARAAKLRPEELSGGTFTVSNLGIVQQVERFTAIINPPQVAILAVGAAKPRPVVIDGGLHIRTTAYVTLSADHRVVNGSIAARFLEALDNQIHSFERTPR
jgi:pyruvate dehydrogenase E2 component (dihydrolipoamide acetyltransferase)